LTTHDNYGLLAVVRNNGLRASVSFFHSPALYCYLFALYLEVKTGNGKKSNVTRIKSFFNSSLQLFLSSDVLNILS